MRRSIVQTIALVSAVALTIAIQAQAFPGLARTTKLACASCHVNPAGGSALAAAGKAYLADKTKVPEAATGSEYVGVNKCKMCHMKEHKSWSETPHAKALTMLKTADAKVVAEMAEKLKVEVKGDAAENDACVVCHVTGFHLAGGFPAADSAKTAAVSNVTCEACHGPGSLHVKAPLADKKKFINRNVTAKLCTQCHTPEMSPKFSFEEFKKRGVHAIPAAAPAK